MKLIRFFFAFLLVGTMAIRTGCGNNSETSRNVIYKERHEVETDVESYLEEKYGKEFIVAVTDSPNHIYSSYEVSAYAADDESKTSCSVTITYVDEENYYATDDYFMYSISDDLEVWFKELADPYIDSDFKAFWRSGLMDLSSDYDDCKTAEDFLELSPTASYYGLRFLIVLPSKMADSDIAAMTDNIASDMLEKRIRGQITTIVYLDEVVYDQINSKEDERYFWCYQYLNYNCCATIQGSFNFVHAELRKAGAWNLDDETYNKRFESDGGLDD